MGLRRCPCTVMLSGCRVANGLFGLFRSGKTIATGLRHARVVHPPFQGVRASTPGAKKAAERLARLHRLPYVTVISRRWPACRRPMAHRRAWGDTRVPRRRYRRSDGRCSHPMRAARRSFSVAKNCHTLASPRRSLRRRSAADPHRCAAPARCSESSRCPSRRSDARHSEGTSTVW